MAKMEIEMKHARRVFILLIMALMTACASVQMKSEVPESPPVATPAPVKEPPKKEIIKKEVIKKELVAEEPEDAGKPVAGHKFAKLKIGMTLSQVKKLIGMPNGQSQHPTEKAAKPFYFGPDRWVIQCSYKGEGMLIFNSGGEQLLTLIQVNKAE
jgi:hypothetical protein